MVRLSNSNLSRLPDGVTRPNYDRSALRPGIVHIGVGNFHRAHQQWYLHRLYQAGHTQDWATIGAGVRPYDAHMRRRLAAQDHLTTLVELAPNGTTAEVVGSMIDYLPVEDGNRTLISQIANAAIRIVSLTVTEGGYYIDPATGAFDATHADIAYDAAHPTQPRTAFGAIVAALKLRRDTGIGPLALQSCDNLQGNGDILRQTVVSLARLTAPDLATWIDETCSFPNSMVDCIVPATGDAEHNQVRSIGIEDGAPVTHENFRQWVIEDNFCCGRPDWDLVGATFSSEVHLYETQKIRLLNAGHQILANAAELLGIRTVAEAMSHNAIRPFFRKVTETEIAPLVKPVPGMTPQAYIDLISERFSNPAVNDTVRRIAFDGSSRHPGFVLPTVRDARVAGAPVEGLALVEAAWSRMCLGQREDGSTITANDPQWARLTDRAQAADTSPQSWLDMRDIYGELADWTAFAARFERAHRKIRDDGVIAAITSYLEGT
ncbi:MAG: mannitol dehydrogenase family protein [Pseudomonadota bacterium]